jgi:Bacterial Ig-like domain
MRIEAKTAIALMSTNLRSALLGGLAVIALTSCGGGDDCAFSAPPPRINSYPPTRATAGHLYGYDVDAAYTCWFLPLVPMTCGGIVGVQLPAGASAGDSGVSWTPPENQVNTDVPFVIATGRDICGHQARQSWTVHVYAPPVIESFTAERAFILPGESTVLIAVFQGTGRIDGLGPVTSGVPVASPVLNTPTTFTLIVTNSASAQVRQTLAVEMPPTVISTNPANGATEVPFNRVLTATFGKQMDWATLTYTTFLLRDAGNNPVSGTVTYANQVATFAPVNSLGYLAQYTATITNGARDRAGNPMITNYVWSFATGAPDTTPPAVISTFPANGADRVASENIELLITFSESIEPNSVNSSTFIVLDSDHNPVNGNIRLINGGATAAFLSSLANSMSYTAIVTTGIKDLAGNRMLADYSWTFTTEAPRFGTWYAMSAAPLARRWHATVWTGSEMIVWGGVGGGNTGARYNPVTDAWFQTSTTGAPTARSEHSAVWTGSEMIVWGGGGGNTGARYDPVTDTWLPTSTSGAPSGRNLHTAVWTGSEMIIWGGSNFQGSLQDSGGRYNPRTDTWLPTSIIGAPSARAFHTAIWTGSEMIIWGGANNSAGARYDPASDSWRPITTSGAPPGRPLHTAVWTGSEMIVWGGYDSFAWFDTGGRYNPATDTWLPTSTTGAPSARSSHATVWTGSEMIVWGGYDSFNWFDTGACYSPTTDTWRTMTTSGAPSHRIEHTAVWTGSEMIVWGGRWISSLLNTGGRFRP